MDRRDHPTPKSPDDGSGNIYTIYFDAWPEEVNLYTEVVNGLFATLTPM